MRKEVIQMAFGYLFDALFNRKTEKYYRETKQHEAKIHRKNALLNLVTARSETDLINAENYLLHMMLVDPVLTKEITIITKAFELYLETSVNPLSID